MDAADGFPARLKGLLEAQGKSPAQVARAIRITKGAVSQWMAGASKPNSDSLGALASALGTTPEWLQFGAGSAPKPDRSAQREAYQGTVGWRFRPAPKDSGRDYGNANVWAFDPKISTMVRDVLQNCRDAELAPGEHVKVEFQVVRLRGKDLEDFQKTQLWDEELLPHLEASAEIDQRLGRLVRHNLRELRQRKELLLLVVSDYGTIGLKGEERGKGNFAALCRNNLDSEKGGNAGGAFGLGKAVLWRVSEFALVLFGSNLSVPTSAGKQSARVFGRCDLPWHEVRGAGEYAGPGWFGAVEREGREELAVSHWDNEALMSDLYMERSDAAPGTSIVVVGFHNPDAVDKRDPANLAEEIEKAVADWFWPDIAQGRLSVRVSTFEGKKPTGTADVSPAKWRPEFVGAYEKWKNEDLVEQLVKEGDVVARKVKLRVPARRADPAHPEVEHDAVVLIRRAGDGPFTERAEDVRLSELAIFRGVRMVVKYLPLKGITLGAVPFHAVLMCGEAAGGDSSSRMADRFLRTAEPPAHSDWDSTPDLQTEYKLGGVTNIRAFIKAVKDAIREVVRPSMEDQSDGPRAIKELLKVTGTPEPQEKPRIQRVTHSEVTADGSWTIEARIRLKKAEEGWAVEPAVTFGQESGGGVRVRWRKLVAVSNCKVDGQKLIIPPGVVEVRFSGETDPEDHPVEARECRAAVEVRRAAKLSGGAE